MHADGLADRLAVRHRTAEAVHAVRHEDLRRIGIELQALHDERIRRDLCHVRILLDQVSAHFKPNGLPPKAARAFFSIIITPVRSKGNSFCRIFWTNPLRFCRNKPYSPPAAALFPQRPADAPSEAPVCPPFPLCPTFLFTEHVDKNVYNCG